MPDKLLLTLKMIQLLHCKLFYWMLSCRGYNWVMWYLFQIIRFRICNLRCLEYPGVGTCWVAACKCWLVLKSFDMVWIESFKIWGMRSQYDLLDHNIFLFFCNSLPENYNVGRIKYREVENFTLIFGLADYKPESNSLPAFVYYKLAFTIASTNFGTFLRLWAVNS